MRILILGTLLGSVILISVSAAIDWPPISIWNASASVPIGLYHVQPEDHLAVADLVVVAPPEPVARFLEEKGYLPRGAPLLKQVLALPGQTVCRIRLAIIIDGVVMATAHERDHRGRPLPVWQGCHMSRTSDLPWPEPGTAARFRWVRTAANLIAILRRCCTENFKSEVWALSPRSSGFLG